MKAKITQQQILQVKDMASENRYGKWKQIWQMRISNMKESSSYDICWIDKSHAG